MIEFCSDTLNAAPRQLALLSQLLRPAPARLHFPHSFAVRPSISLPPYRDDVNHPVTKSESCLMKRNERWTASLIRTEHSRKISVSICVSHPMAAAQPHPLTPASSTLPIYFFFLRVTCNMRAKGQVLSRTTLHPHPFAHLFLNVNLHPSITNPLATAHQLPLP